MPLSCTNHWWRRCRTVCVSVVALLLTHCGGGGGGDDGGSGVDAGGGEVAPGGQPSSPIPIELPAQLVFPSTLSLSVANVSSANLARLLLGKSVSVPGDSALAQSVYVVGQDNQRIDTILATLRNIAVETSSSTTSAIGSTPGGNAWAVDFSAFEFPTLSSTEITSVDCSATCSGTAGALPICVRVTIGGQRVWHGKFMAAPNDTSKGKGCFYTFSTVTADTNEGALYDGSESYLLAGIWDETDAAAPKVEYFTLTTAANADGLTVPGHHAVVTGTTPSSSSLSRGRKSSSGELVTTARASGSVVGAGATKTIEAIHKWRTVVDRATYTLTDDATTHADGCFDLNTGLEVSGIAEYAEACAALDISGQSTPTNTGPPSYANENPEAEEIVPTVSSVSPTSGATDVAINAQISVAFSVAMDAATLTTSNIVVTPSGGAAISGSVTTTDTTATFTPTSDLGYETTYTVQISSNVKSAAGVFMASAVSTSFTTGEEPADTTAPALTDRSPADGATGVELGAAVVASFSEVMNNTTATSDTMSVSTGGSPVSGTVIYSYPNYAQFTPSSQLLPETTYSVAVTTGLTDLAGNALNANYTWNFTTGAPDSGTLDIFFDSDGRASYDMNSAADEFKDVAIQNDGKIVAVGCATTSVGTRDMLVIRYGTNGTLDSSFGSAGVTRVDVTTDRNDCANAVAIRESGAIVLAGYTTPVSGGLDLAIVQLDASGQLDTNFGGGDGIVTVNNGTTDYANDVVIDTSGGASAIVAVGKSTTGLIVRLDSNGVLDGNFDGDGIATTVTGSDVYTGITMHPDPYTGIAYIAGYNSTTGFVHALNTTLGSISPITTFQGQSGLRTRGIVTTGAAQDYWVAGYDNSRGFIHHLTSDNTTNSPLMVSVSGYATTRIMGLSLLSSGQLVFSGGISNGSSPGEGLFIIGRTDTSGAILDETFGDGRNGLQTATTATSRADYLQGIAVQSNGRIVGVGYANESATGDDAVILRLWP